MNKTKRVTKLDLDQLDYYTLFVNKLKDEYLESWMTLGEFSKRYNISVALIKHILNKEDLIKDLTKWNPSKNPENIAKIKQTKLERYGDSNYNNFEKSRKTREALYNGNFFSERGYENFTQKSAEMKKQIVDKSKETCLERYGVDNIFKDSKRIQNAFEQKYGVSNPSKLDSVKDKKQRKSLEKYGTNCTFQAEEVKAKAKESHLKNFGVDNPMKSVEIQSKARITRFKNGTQRYDGTEVDTFLSNWDKKRKPTVSDFHHYVNNSNLSNAHKMVWHSGRKEDFSIRASFLESIVEDFLILHNLSYEKRNRKIIKPFEVDFYLPEFNLALEINDLWSHNSSVGIHGHEPRPLNYHFNKTVKCREVGVRLIHLFEPHILGREWEVLQDIILHTCGQSKKIYARNTQVKIFPAKELKGFFETNNIQGYRGAKKAFTLVDKSGEIIMAYTIGDAFFGKGKYDAEIVRGACKLGYAVVGGASKLWSAIINYYSTKNLLDQPGQINSIVYYVDNNYYNGSSMAFLKNVEFVREQLGFWNYWKDDKVLKNREPGRHKLIKELELQGKILVVGNSGTSVNVWKR